MILLLRLPAYLLSFVQLQFTMQTKGILNLKFMKVRQQIENELNDIRS